MWAMLGSLFPTEHILLCSQKGEKRCDLLIKIEGKVCQGELPGTLDHLVSKKLHVEASNIMNSYL